MNAKIIFGIVFFFGMQVKGHGQFGSIAIALGPSFSKPKATFPGYTVSGHSDGVARLAGFYSLGKKVGLVFDVGICNRGMVLRQPVTVSTYDPYSGTTDYNNETNKYRHGLSYLDNTLMVRSTVGGKLKLYVNGGLYYGVLLKAKKLIVDEYYNSNGQAGISELHSRYDNDTDFLYKHTDFGMAVGLGIQKERFGLDYRYCLGLKEISDIPEAYVLRHSFSTVTLSFVFVKFNNDALPHAGAHKKKAR